MSESFSHVRQPSTELGDRLLCAAKAIPFRAKEYREMAWAVNEAAAHAITLGFTKESMLALNGAWAKGWRALKDDSSVAYPGA